MAGDGIEEIRQDLSRYPGGETDGESCQGPIHGSFHHTLLSGVLLLLGEKEHSLVLRFTKKLIPYRLKQCEFFYFSVLYAVLVKLTFYETMPEHRDERILSCYNSCSCLFSLFLSM